MGITDLFRPNWKHSDAGVRSKAVRAMDADDQPLLVEIAKTDSDRAIRELAVSKINDADALEALAEGCGADRETLADLARERACSLRIAQAVQGEDAELAEAALAHITNDMHLADILRRAQLESIRRGALDRLEDERALAEVIRTSKDRELCKTLMDRITDPVILRSLALEEQRRDLAQAALDRIEDPEALRAVAKDGKIKAVRKRAKRMLDAAEAPNPEEQAQNLAQKKIHAQLVQLCRTVEKRTGSSDWEETTRVFAEAQARWDELTAQWQDDDEKLVGRFEAACKGFAIRWEQAHAHLADRDAKVAAQQADRDAEVAAQQADRDAEVAARQEHRAELDARTSLCEQILALEGDHLADDLTGLQAQWEERGEIPEPIRVELEKRYETAVRQCTRQMENLAEQEADREALEALIAEGVRALKVRKMVALQKRFEPLQKRWSRAVAAGVTSEAQREQFDELVARFNERTERDQAAQEQRAVDNQARIEALIEQVNGAVTSKDLREAERLLTEARATLKRPGPLPNREIGKTLRPLLDDAQAKLHERVGELREGDNWKRWANTPRAEELCVRAEELAKVEDLAEVAKQLRPLQNEWKKIGPVTQDQASARWLRFKEACDAAYTRCEPYFAEQDLKRKENLDLKEQLCVQVEELAESGEWNETADRIKQLQSEWKEIGPVPRKVSDAVWKRFRAPCDAFFDRRKEYFKTQDAERKVNLEKKEAMCEQAETLAESSDWPETAERLKQLQADWKSGGPVPRNRSDAIWQRFRTACDHFFARRASHLDEGRSENLAQKRTLCEELEKALSGEGEPVKPEDLAQKLLETWDTWKSIGPIPFDEEKPLGDRLSAITTQAVEAHPAAFKGSSLDPEANARRKTELCMQAEVLAITAQEKREGERLKLEEQDAESMAARLKEAMASNTYGEESRAEDVQRLSEQVTSLRRAWTRAGPVPGDEGTRLQERFDKACKEAMGSQDG
jgi:Domain of Unknown Function (DUF349)